MDTHAARRVFRTPGHRPSGRPAGGASRPPIFVWALVGVAVLVGCEEIVVSNVPVAGVEVVPADTTLIPGERLSFRVELYGDQHEVLSGREVAWRSEDMSVVSINEDGSALAVGPGATEVTATAEGTAGKASVVVTRLPRIDLNRSFVAFSMVAGGPAPSPIEVRITNGGDGSLGHLSATVTYEGEPVGWLGVVLASAEAPATMTLTVETAPLEGGTYGATVRVADAQAANSPAALEVTLQVQEDVPAAPSNLDATDVSDSVIVLSWSDNSENETGFQVHREAPGEEAPSLLGTVDPDVTTYRDEAVAADGRYVYQVRACNNSGCSPFSGQVSPTTPPVAPSNVTAEAAGPTMVEIGWVDNSVTETGFEVERRTVGADFALVGSVETDSVAFVDTGLEPGTEYDYRVRACNDGGCSAYAGPVSVTTEQAATPPPSTPTNFQAEAESKSKIDLQWDDVDTEDSYELERSTNGTNFSLLATLAADDTGYTDSGLDRRTTYYYRLRACNDGGCSEWAGPIAETTED